MSPELDNLPIGESEEVEPGVIIERRSFLKLASGVLALAAAPTTALAQLSTSNESIDYEEFLEAAIPVAKKLVTDTSRAGQDRYLFTIAALTVQMTGVPIPAFRDGGQGKGPGTFIGFNPGGDPFRVLHWKMDPGSVVKTHAHTYGNVVTVGLEGAVNQINFEVVGEPDFETESAFRVRQTQDQLLATGCINLVNLQRDYIHGSIASPLGGRGLDITTRIKPKPAHPVPYLVLGEPVDGHRREFEAHWES